MLMVLFWQDAKPAGPQWQRFKWSKSFSESVELSKKNRQILNWNTFFIGFLRPMFFIPTSNVPDPKDIKTHRLPIVGADRITHGCHCLNGWCVVVLGYATCSCNERMTWWPQPFCTLNVVLLICSIKFSAASAPFFGWCSKVETLILPAFWKFLISSFQPSSSASMLALASLSHLLRFSPWLVDKKVHKFPKSNLWYLQVWGTLITPPWTLSAFSSPSTLWGESTASWAPGWLKGNVISESNGDLLKPSLRGRASATSYFKFWHSNIMNPSNIHWNL